MNKKFRNLILPLSLLLASQVLALGLGNLQVDSSLDEELKGEIPLVVGSDEEIENISVTIASEADYDRVGLDKSYVPSNILVNILDRNGGKYIDITSRGPVSEPIVSLLLVVDWANGHLLREYTLLLDPPLYNNQQNYSEPVKTQSYQSSTALEETQTEETQTEQTIPESNVSNEVVIPATSASQVIVEAGDTLWKIATRFNSGLSSTQQMMVAIFNNNPTAFRDDDMNLLKKGAVLDIPGSDEVSLVSNDQAISEVKSQAQNWRRLQTQGDSYSDNSSSSADYGIELVSPSNSDSSSSNYDSGSAKANSALKAELNRAKEELASSNLENSELASRVRELERIVKDQELALSLKDSDLAQLQDQLSTTESSTASSEDMVDDVWNNDTTDSMDTMAETDEMANDSLPNSDSMDTMTDSMAETENMDSSTDSMTDSENMDSMAENDSMDSMDSSTEMADDSSDEMSGSDESQKAVETVVTPVVEEKSLLDKILDYKYEGLIALGVLLLGGLGFLYFKRRDDEEAEVEGGFLDSISNNNDSHDADLNETTLDSDITELNLSGFDEEVEDESSEEGAPEVVVMNDPDNETELASSLDDNLLDENLELDTDSQEDSDKSEDFSLDIEENSFDEIDLDESLDLDLENSDDEMNFDDLSFDLEDAAESKTENTPETETEDSKEESLEFDDELSLDFDLDDLDISTEDSETENEEKESVEQLLEDDFSLDLELNSDEKGLDDILEEGEELEDLVFDTGERSVVEETDKAEDANELDDLEFDLDDDLFTTDDLELEEPAEELNLGEISLDEISDDNTQDEVTPDKDDTISLEGYDDLDDAQNEEESLEDGEFDLGLDFDDLVDDAVDTKLDLAKAYFEMGDVDGAKQMVVEIIEEGTEEQKVKAEELKNEIESS